MHLGVCLCTPDLVVGHAYITRAQNRPNPVDQLSLTLKRLRNRERYAVHKIEYLPAERFHERAMRQRETERPGSCPIYVCVYVVCASVCVFALMCMLRVCGCPGFKDVTGLVYYIVTHRGEKCFAGIFHSRNENRNDRTNSP